MTAYETAELARLLTVLYHETKDARVKRVIKSILILQLELLSAE